VNCEFCSRYRTITGKCNKRRNSLLGACNRASADGCQQTFEDGVSVPHGCIHSYGHFLTHTFCFHPLQVQKVSNKIARFSPGQLKLDQQRSLTFMQWGHFIDHDLDFSPESPSRVAFSGKADCHTSCAKLPPCFPIQIPPNNPRIKNTRDRIPFFRSAPACDSSRATREQISALTSFLNGSMAFGSEQPLVSKLKNRNNKLGLLAVNHNFTDKGMAYLPSARMPCVKVSGKANVPCFFAGDSRASGMLELACMHTLFVQEHKCLARELKRLNPHWNGEKLYQEAWKIVGAMIQVPRHPPALLPSPMDSFLQGLQGVGGSCISSVFTMAFRFAHASIPFKTFFGVWHVVKGSKSYVGITEITGLLRLEKTSKIIQSNCHLLPIERIGLDLALNMQRGRDHGLPGKLTVAAELPKENK
uniref:Uncharacterized protein n=1 Tax=Meleagris gallopavo TaxID=9103 RepID=G1MST1_MELGA